MLMTTATHTVGAPTWIGRILSEQDIAILKSGAQILAMMFCIILFILGVWNLVQTLRNMRRKSIFLGMLMMTAATIIGTCVLNASIDEISTEIQNMQTAAATEMPAATKTPAATQQPVYVDTPDYQKQIVVKYGDAKQTAQPKTPEELAARTEISKLAAISIISLFGIVALVIVILAACLTVLILLKRLEIRKTGTGKLEIEIADENTGGDMHE